MTREEDHAGVGFPPPLVYLGFLLLGLLADRFVFDASSAASGLGLSTMFRYGFGGALVIAGLTSVLAGNSRFSNAGTEVKPWRPASLLVTGGIYRFTRNPMYLGLTLASAGIAILLDSLGALLSVPVSVVAITTQVIAREEAYLERRFGEVYRTYKARVRRWI